MKSESRSRHWTQWTNESTTMETRRRSAKKVRSPQIQSVSESRSRPWTQWASESAPSRQQWRIKKVANLVGRLSVINRWYGCCLSRSAYLLALSASLAHSASVPPPPPSHDFPSRNHHVVCCVGSLRDRGAQDKGQTFGNSAELSRRPSNDAAAEPLL